MGLGRFEPLPPGRAPVLDELRVSRGLAVGDLDNDGDLDAVSMAIGEPPQLLLNRFPRSGSWIGIELSSRGRPALGATATVLDVSPVLWARARTDGSYSSADQFEVSVVEPRDVNPVCS